MEENPKKKRKQTLMDSFYNLTKMHHVWMIQAKMKWLCQLLHHLQAQLFLLILPQPTLPSVPIVDPSSEGSSTLTKQSLERKLQDHWFNEFTWLRKESYESSEQTKYRLYCDVCRLQTMKSMMASGTSNFRKADIKKHGETMDHKKATDLQYAGQQKTPT